MDTSYLAQQVTTIIGQLHGLFDEIGVASHERDSREAEVSDATQDPILVTGNMLTTSNSSSPRCPKHYTISFEL